MSEMAERVARALTEAIEDQASWTMRCTETLDVDGHLSVSDLARAAIAAMRKPTQKMRECGHMAGWPGVIEGCDAAEEDAAQRLWESMVDAAQGEECSTPSS